jgi:hypothetical protein
LKLIADRGRHFRNAGAAWYSVSSKGLLEAAKFVKDFFSEIDGTLKNLGSQLPAGFQVDGHF